MTSRKLITCLLASMVILRPLFFLKIWQMLCLMCSVALVVLFVIARPSSL